MICVMKPTNRLTMLSRMFLLLLSASAAQAASETLYPDTVVPGARPADAPNRELGTIVRATAPGKITSARVFSLSNESGDHQVRIWRNADNTRIAGPITWTYGGEEAWITLGIPDVAIEANQDYTIAVSAAADGVHPSIGGYFGSAGNNGQNLDYPQGAGVFSDVPGARPTQSSVNSAYLRDIVFEADLSGTVMRVRGNGNTIVDGAASTTLANGTDVGGRGLNSGTRDQTYTVLNVGQTGLDLNGNPRVTIAGAQASDFTVTVQP